MAAKQRNRSTARNKAYRRVLAFPQARDKIIERVELDVSPDYYIIEIRFQDKTTLNFKLEPCVMVGQYSGHEIEIHKESWGSPTIKNTERKQFAFAGIIPFANYSGAFGMNDRLRVAQSSLGCRLGSDGLYYQKSKADQGNENPTDGEQKIGTIQRIFAGIVGVFLVILSTWCLYVKATETFPNRNFWSWILLFVLCFVLSVPFLDTGLTGTSIWVRLAEGCE